MHRWLLRTVPCLQEGRDYVYRIEEQPMCRTQPVDTQWVAAEGERVVGLAHLQPVSSVHRQAPQEDHRRAQHVAAAAAADAAAASQRDDAHRRPCARLPLPSSWPSILCGSP